MALFLAGVQNSLAFSPYYSNGRLGRWDLNYAYEATLFNSATKAIKFYLGSDTATVPNRTAELNAIRASFAQWQAVPGTSLKFEEAGITTTGLDINLDDYRNLVFWAKSNTVNGGRDNITGLSGYTLVLFDDENRIQEADVALNAASFNWNTDFNNTTTVARFVEGVMLHEIGHFIGLDHTPLGGGTVIENALGVGPSAGLSTDEMAAARFLYPGPGAASQYGNISGTVRLNGTGIRGAMVTAESPNGIAISAAPSLTGGAYNLASLPPGNYNVRVSPLDPDTASTSHSLWRGRDIARDFGTTVTAFKASENSAVTVTAGATTTLNFAVTGGEPAFRVQQISKPFPNQSAPSPIRYAVMVRRGETFFTGVASATLPSDATFSITGDGITIGSMIYEANRFASGLHLLQAAVTISSNATPGMRSFVVRRGSDVAYANGYLEIADPAPDYNFDGLNDYFQRQYFPLFTSPEAAPGADPDADRFSNAFEALTGTIPTNANSFSLRVERVDLLPGQARVTWKSDVGKQYQLYGKADVAGAAWQTIGGPVTATTASTTVSDASGGVQKFYKIRLLP